jgi:ComF family protein
MRASGKADGSRVLALFRHGGGAILDVLLPAQCLTCDNSVGRQGELCPACWGGVHPVTSPMCDRCGVPFLHAWQGGAVSHCPGCEARPPAYATARAAFRYDEGAKRLLLPFKHADRIELARAIASRMARAGAPLLARAALIAPVPLHWRRLATRRYNQAALLAGELSTLTGKPCVPDLLERIRPTPTLGDRGAGARAAVVEGVFRVRPAVAERVFGRRILLVDDVMTSGATADSCARALLDAGASAVDALAAARVPDPRLERAP